MTFIDALAHTFIGNSELDKTLFVFPSRRAGAFFHHAMLRLGGPEDIHTGTLEDVFKGITGLSPVSRITALAELYRCWNGLSDEKESFDSFLAWGDTLLSDLDEVNTANIDMSKLPTDLDGFLSSVNTESAERLCRSLSGVASGKRGAATLWPRLAPLQSSLRQSLALKGGATAGGLQREAAMRSQAAPTVVSVLPRYEHVVLCGLGRLSPCEKTVLRRLAEEGRAEFFWDFDGKAVTDPEGSAAGFMAENMRLFPQRRALDCPAADMAAQKWAVIHVPSATAQAEVAAEEIEEALLGGAAADDIAVVLSDPSLLQPVLDAIPDSVEKINVTMGQPLSGSAATALIDALDALRHNCRTKNGNAAFHRAEALAVLAHPYVRAAAPDAEAVSEMIRTGGRAFLPAETFAGGSPALAKIFTPAANDVPAWLLDIFEAVQSCLEPLDREYVALYHSLVSELRDAAPAGLSSAAWMRLVRRGAALAKIPFEGEPLQGLQVMGLLETRCLDFGTVIHVGASEGMLPAPGSRTSMLPQALRSILGLPSPASREGSAAYHFWRGACRAERVVMIHDCRTDGMQCGEETRYAKQLRHLYGVTPREETVATTVDPEALAMPAISVVKSAAVMDVLKEKFVSGSGAFSASSLNAYLSCRLRYWWEHVLGIQEEDDMADTPDAALMGTIYHSVMENIYKPLVGKTLEAPDIEALRDADRLECLASAAFAEAGILDIEGPNLILRDVVIRLVDKTLETDAGIAPLTILGTEKSLAKDVILPVAGVTVRLYGKIDRLDRTGDGTCRVVDYKSGSVKGKDGVRDAARVFDRSLGVTRPTIGLQLLLYALLAEGKGLGAEPCIYSTRGLFDGAPKTAAVEDGTLREFERLLTETIEEIFNPEVPFTATEDTDKCGFCPFSKICNRN